MESIEPGNKNLKLVEKEVNFVAIRLDFLYRKNAQNTTITANHYKQTNKSIINYYYHYYRSSTVVLTRNLPVRALRLSSSRAIQMSDRLLLPGIPHNN